MNCDLHLKADTQLRDSLREAATLLYPLHSHDGILTRHVWRTRNDVGETAAGIATWRGWSIGLHRLNGPHRTVYADWVDNVLPEAERDRLFGKEFAQVITDMPHFTIFFVTKFLPSEHEIIQRAGFVPRVIGRRLHACMIVRPADLISQPAQLWAYYAAQLANLQAALRPHIPKPKLHNDPQPKSPKAKSKLHTA